MPSPGPNVGQDRYEHPSEDDMVQADLGPRGVPGEPFPGKMTPQREKKTPKNVTPGHTE
jgi:hypothetical protein